MKLKHQAYLLAAMILLALFISSAFGLWSARVASSDDNKARVTELFNSAYSILTEVEKMAQEGKMTESEAKALATRLLRNNLYKDNEYVYVVDSNMTFVAAPLDPQLHGTSFNDFKDADGNSIGQLIQRVLGSRNSQLVEYTWHQALPDGTIEKKLSIAKKTPHWGWVVGTGIGFNEVNTRFWSNAQWQLLIGLLAGGMILLALTVAIKRILNLLGGEPDDVRAAVQSVANGEIRTTFPTTAPQGSIYLAVQQMSVSLAQLMGQLEQSMQALRGELAHVADRANALTSLSETQQQSTEMIATAMTEMASSTGHVAESAKETAHNTQDADQQSQYTQQLIQSTVVNIEGLATELSTAGQAVSHLDNDINSIAKVLNVIGDIAEQTNLLALNAAIEAARAGEQGRGFAVVADEVRSLAGRTQNSTKEIREMIDNLQQSSRHALTAMDTCASTSMSTVEQSRQASESLSQIVQALESITTMSHQIASAADQQKQVGDDIAERINLIDDSGRQLSTVITQSHDSTTTLSALSQALEDAISQFTILSAPRR